MPVGLRMATASSINHAGRVAAVPAYANLRVDKTDNEALSSEGDEQDLAALCSAG